MQMSDLPNILFTHDLKMNSQQPVTDKSSLEGDTVKLSDPT
jgi:hypothetical protein